MNEEQLEAELADWSRRRREIDAGNAPAFAQVWTVVRARHERAQRRVSLSRVSAITAIVVLAVAVVSVVRPRSEPNEVAPRESASVAVPWRTTVLISSWRAPTDFLFVAPDAGFAFLAREAEQWNRDSAFRANRAN